MYYSDFVSTFSVPASGLYYKDLGSFFFLPLRRACTIVILAQNVCACGALRKFLEVGEREPSPTPPTAISTLFFTSPEGLYYCNISSFFFAPAALKENL